MAVLLKQDGNTAVYQDIEAAREALLALARGAQDVGKREAVELFLEEGRYSLSAPFRLSLSEEPALSSLDITLLGENAQLHSLVSLGAKPQKCKDHFTYKLKKEGETFPIFRELFLDGARVPLSTSPVWKNTDIVTEDERTGKTKREGFYVPLEIAKQLVSAPIGKTELIVYILWLYASFHVSSVEFDKTREVDGETYVLVKPVAAEMEHFTRVFPRHMNIGASKLHFRNSPAFLQENTFAYDHESGTLYLAANAGKDVSLATLEYPTLETLVEIEGVDGVTIEGIRFTGVTDKYHSQNMVYPHQAGGIVGLGLDGDKAGRRKEAAVYAGNVRGFTVKDCHFYSVGTNGVQVADRSARTAVEGCVFDDVSMCAVSIGNCSWNWQIERNRTFNARIENNYFRHIAYEYPACPCIYIGQVDGLRILRNTVDGCAYSGVSAGWNWEPVSWEVGEKVNIRNAEIAYNYFHNFMDLLHDGGAIYVVGSNANRATRSDYFNFMHHNYATLDKAGPAGDKYGYYLDGASSNWEMRDSVIINCLTPVFSQPHPQALSYHNLIQNIYSTKPYTPHLHAPARDVLIRDFHLVPEGEAALFEKHPEAQKIKENAGASPEVKPTRR